ncbi:hypothetical protein GGI20_005804 [Coemansia sp. BCRC 34301]|nr:hypothetical protein GGI20_005804 [Coemansia sp. BCRC 34301]
MAELMAKGCRVPGENSVSVPIQFHCLFHDWNSSGVHVVRLIVDNVVPTKRSSSVCSRIYTNAYLWFLGRCTLGAATFALSFTHVDHSLPNPELDLVKHLSIRLMEAGLYSDDAMRLLSRLPVERIVEANIDAFVRGVKIMVPMLNEVRVRIHWSRYMPAVAHCYADRLAMELFQLANSVEYTDHGELTVPPSLEVGGICRLTHIKCDYMGAGRQFMLPVWLNAPTLQSLDLCIDLSPSASILIQNYDGSHVTYPQLATLSMPFCKDYDALQLHLVSEDVVPFPSLRSVDMSQA